MSSRTLISLFITLIIGSLLVAIVLDYYSLENKLKRVASDIEEATEKEKRFRKEMRQAAEKEEQKRRLHNIRVSTAFKEGRCQDLLKLLKFEEPLNTPNILLKADLHMRGKCLEQNFSEAFAIYEKKLKEIYNYGNKDTLSQLLEGYYGHIAHIKFRLATLYWRGQGVTQDQNKAQALAKKAAIMLGPWLARERHLETTNPALNSSPANIWRMPQADILENVTFHATGPWNMPKPLSQQIAWLKDIHKNGGKAYLEIGLHLLHGTGGYEKDPVMAYEWIYISSHFYGYGPAHYPRAMLLRNEPFRDLKQKFPIFSIDFNKFREKISILNSANDMLRRAAKAGDIRADKELLHLAKQTTDHTDKNNNIYFWMLRLHQKKSDTVSETDIAAMRKKLSKYDIESVERAVKENRLPSVLMTLPKNSP